MTALLEKAVDRLKKRTVEEQESIATLILEELDSEEVWDEKFKASSDKLGQLARAALAEYRAGKTLPLDPDAL